MATRLTVFAALLAVTLSGCSRSPRLMSESVPVSGKVLLPNGAPVGNVVLTLQPTQQGHPTALLLGADGAFRGDLVPGKYVYFLQARDARGTGLQAVPEKYRSPTMDNQVQVGSGDLEIRLN